MNTQFAIQNNVVYLLEVNPRASRTVPFVSKAIGIPLAKIAAKVMVGESLVEAGFRQPAPSRVLLGERGRVPVHQVPGADPILGPEMKSTGEVMGVGARLARHMPRRSWRRASVLPRQGAALLSVRDRDKEGAVELGENTRGARLRYRRHARHGQGSWPRLVYHADVRTRFAKGARILSI